MKETEGVIKYSLKHDYTALDEHISIAELNAWRSILLKLELIGQIPGRYKGYGFGNISQRISSKNPKFVITGTQTGNISLLSKCHYCTVLDADPANNFIKSSGEVKPSSEALTHASIYLQDDSIRSIIHIHCPEIWDNTEKLKLPYTVASIAYGTPEMANEVKRLMQLPQTKQQQVFSMLGHEDGIIAFSDSMEKSGCTIIKLLSQAKLFSQDLSSIS